MDRISTDRRSWNMSRIKSHDTSIELKVRRSIYSKGYRFRVRNSLPGKPDMIFPGKKIAVFVNGCFWHMHGCRLSATPATNTKFWVEKLGKNRERDLEVRRKLENDGWKVIVLWECEIEENIENAVGPLLLLLGDGRKL